ncbi:hypothetical protein [Streptomyces jumonjinensis]|uniref:hypothetical protein n=1 Tax=Streptomyces jumonjinensis TaxID=1945 RepID=UPI0037B10932
MKVDFYWCEITLYSGGREYLYGGKLAESPRLAVRWLAGQAVRLADLMEPHPLMPWLSENPGAIREVGDAESESQAPEELRAWESDSEELGAAMKMLVEGEFFRLVVSDDGMVINLTARPMPTNFVAAWRKFESSYQST